MVEGALAFYAALPYDLGISPLEALDKMYDLVHSPHTTTLVHVDSDDAVGAALCWVVGQNPWNDALMSSELFFFNLCAPPQAAMRLLRAYESRAKEQGVRYVTFTHLASADPRVGKLYSRLGALPTEMTYMKEL